MVVRQYRSTNARERWRDGDSTGTNSSQILQCDNGGGSLSQPVPVDQLTTLSINNFPELLGFRDNELTAPERLPEDDPNHEDPMTGSDDEVQECGTADGVNGASGPSAH